MEELLSIRTIINKFSAAALGGKKIPHGVSNPVFRRNGDGNIEAAAFIFIYNKEQLKSRSVPRPKKWMTMDLSTGEITEHDCSENDFCDLPDDMMCGLDAEENTVFSEEYKRQTLAVFDLTLKKYLVKNKFDKELNDAYMYMMLRMVSVGFKELYTQLNTI